MASSDPLGILLTHNTWATHQTLDACEALGSEQFQQRFEMGPGSLHDTLVHVLSAMEGWGELLSGQPIGDGLGEGDFQIAELRTRLDALSDHLAAHVRPVDELVSGERGGRSYQFARGAVVTHVATHGMHHRAQCLNMLRALGVDPLPPVSVLEWMLMVDGQG